MSAADTLLAVRSVWRAWDGTRQVALAVAGAIVLHLWSGPIDVPGRDDIAETIWPLVPTFLALACLAGARTALGDAERTTPRGASLLRLGYLLAVAALAAALLPLSGPLANRAVIVRNDALLCGLALLAVELLPAATAWAPLVLLPMLTWLLGSNGLGVAPEDWALLLHTAPSASARTVSLLTLAAGTAVYVFRPVCDPLIRGVRSGRRRPSRRGCCSPPPRR